MFWFRSFFPFILCIFPPPSHELNHNAFTKWPILFYLCKQNEPPSEEGYYPIFIEEEKRLKQLLTCDQAKQPDVILLTGTHGIGKTTLAAKMFQNSEIKNHFDKHIWASVRNPTAKNILLVVLRILDPAIDPKEMSLCELRDKVRSLLKGHNFLLVLDNVPDWSKGYNSVLRSAIRESDKRSRVLITSTNPKLDEFVNADSHIKLNLLKHTESWDLLKWKLYPEASCPPEVEIHGQVIAESCNGSPEEIILTAEALTKALDQVTGSTSRIQVWKDFRQDIIPFNESSYNELPYNLRSCFLYLGIFPRHSKFPVSKLIQMWIAEGFITPDEEDTSEETAEKYLMQLVDKNLVKIEEKRHDGSAKTCSITESARKFCQKESAPGHENLLQEFKTKEGEGLFPHIDVIKDIRRVCIHDHISKFIPTFISSRQDEFRFYLRSFVSHSTDAFTLRKRQISKMRAAFKLLRVLDAKPITVNKIHSDLCLLVHLRYVTLSLNGDVLPGAISRLQNVQTLIVHTTSRTLTIEVNILEMAELRHFETDASATLSKKSEASQRDDRLQTLYGVSPESCTEEFFNKLPNLKKVGICGKLALLRTDGKNDLLSKLVKVEKLKLLNQEKAGGKKRMLLKWKKSSKHEAKLSSMILQPSRFPPSLRSLTLSATFLDWKHISILGSLPELKELKLKDNAFHGDKWDVNGTGFPNLQTLKIESLHFKQWQCSSAHFPQLRRLMLSECKQLKEIPIALADIPTFQELHFPEANGCAQESAVCIRDKKLEMKKTDTNIVFKLLPKAIFR